MNYFRSDNFKTAYIALGTLLFVIIVGVFGYMLIEGFRFSEAFYMTIITIATVGFKEVKPLSSYGMWFTAFLIIFSFGIFAFVVTTFTRYLVDGVFRQHLKLTKLKRKIDNIQDHVVICGFGRNGRQAALDLLEHEVPVIIIEKEDKAIEKIQAMPGLLYVKGNATHDEILHLVQLQKAKALITTLPFDADNLFVVLSVREINPDLTIISRASNEHSSRKLKRAGATNVIMPEKVGGQRMAKLVAQPDIVEFLDYITLQRKKDVNLEEISCEGMVPCYIDSTIAQLRLRNLSGANIVGLKKDDGSYIFNPPPDLKISSKYQIFVLGNPEQINELRKVLTENPEKS